MKKISIFTFVILTAIHCYGQQNSDDNKKIKALIEIYSKSVIDRDSIAFYSLFNDDPVVWCASYKDRTQAREIETKGKENVQSSYFSGSYKSFLRSLFRHKATEDKFDNIKIVEDGTVASVTMDYSFWADHKMTNWGSKYLSLIKKEGKWKITSVIYSLELVKYFKQPDRDRQIKQ